MERMKLSKARFLRETVVRSIMDKTNFFILMENVQSNTESQKLAPRPERFEAWLQNAYENGVMSRETARDLLERYRTEKKGVFAESRTEMRKLSAKVPKKALVGESKRADAKRPERKFGNGESLPEKAPSGIGNAKTESSAPARDVQPGAGDLKKEEVGVLAEYWEAAKELVGVFERHSPKLGMQYVNSADVAAIGLVESGFDPRARNPAGGAGAMQITGHPIRELSRNPAYKPLVTEILEAEGAKSIAAYRNPKELYDLKANAIIGISYAKRCEDIPPLPDSLFKKMCGMKDHLSKVS